MKDKTLSAATATSKSNHNSQLMIWSLATKGAQGWLISLELILDDSMAVRAADPAEQIAAKTLTKALKQNLGADKEISWSFVQFEIEIICLFVFFLPGRRSFGRSAAEANEARQATDGPAGDGHSIVERERIIKVFKLVKADENVRLCIWNFFLKKEREIWFNRLPWSQIKKCPGVELCGSVKYVQKYLNGDNCDARQGQQNRRNFGTHFPIRFFTVAVTRHFLFDVLFFVFWVLKHQLNLFFWELWKPGRQQLLFF